MGKYKIALYPGDGIGPEVTREAVRAMVAAAELFGFEIDFPEFDWGANFWQRTGLPAPGDFLNRLRGFDAVFLGAVGAPDLMPDHVSLEPLIRMRQVFEQYACVRPAVLLPGVGGPLAEASVDLVVVRENSEGEYVSAGGFFRRGGRVESAVQSSLHTRLGITRLLRYAFCLARERRGGLTMATKSNALAFSMVLWDTVLGELAEEFPDVSCEKVHVDALAMRFVRCPEQLDVVAASNLFGDILSDLAGAVTGSIGLAPSANINPEKKFPSLFEPVHGSAPDIAGRGIANPAGAVRSAAMLLDFLGEKHAAGAVEKAVREVLAEGLFMTPDLGGGASTKEMGAEIEGKIRHLRVCPGGGAENRGV